MDLKDEKIPNNWILTGWTAGILFQLFLNGVIKIPYFLSGALLPIVMLFPLFTVRMLGAGDIKLLSVLGVFMGPVKIFICILYSFLCGAVLSFAFLIFCHSLFDRMQYFITYFQRFIHLKQRIPYRLPGKKRPEHLHFSVAVLMGVLLWIGGFY